MNPPDAELEDLVSQHLDGRLTSEQEAGLRERLRSDAAARRRFVELSDLHAMLAGDVPLAGEVLAERDRASAKIIPHPNWRRWWAPVAAAAGVMLLAGGGWWWQTQRVFATVANGAGVEELADGARLRGEQHEIKAGTVELVTARGARVVIEAPAEFRFESAQRLRMTRGRLAADVPPSAKGFTVVTPSGDAVDLGTRFGVDVPASGAAEIHVFQGEVIAKASGASAKQSLLKGDAVTMDQGASTARELRSSAFIQPDEMPELTAGLAAGQRARSNEVLATLKSDPTLIALLDFESDESHAGVFRTAQGRWPGSRAPEFVNVGDHMILDVGGERAWPQLTLAAWVRMDRLGAPYQSLLHTDGWDKNHPGQVHWMVTRATVMRLALFGNTLAPGSDETEQFPDSRTPVLPEQGRWVHLATVYDSEKRTVRFYLNGQFDRETRQAIAHPARLGPAQIGNWDRKDRKLSGRIDELLVLGRAMSDDEVHALYVAGNPYH